MSVVSSYEEECIQGREDRNPKACDSLAKSFKKIAIGKDNCGRDMWSLGSETDDQKSPKKRVGRPRIDRSLHCCSECNSDKTPQWRFISLEAAMDSDLEMKSLSAIASGANTKKDKLCLCNACWLRVFKARRRKQSSDNHIECYTKKSKASHKTNTDLLPPNAGFPYGAFVLPFDIQNPVYNTSSSTTSPTFSPLYLSPIASPTSFSCPSASPLMSPITSPIRYPSIPPYYPPQDNTSNPPKHHTLPYCPPQDEITLPYCPPQEEITLPYWPPQEETTLSYWPPQEETSPYYPPQHTSRYYPPQEQTGTLLASTETGTLSSTDMSASQLQAAKEDIITAPQ